jgi:transcription termination factor NusB
MDPAVASIIVAAIAAAGGILGIVLNKTKNEIVSSKKETMEMRKENKEDHAVVASLLNKVIHDVHKVDEKLDKHIETHHIS